VPRLNVDVSGNHERHGGEFPVPGFAMPAPVLLKVARIAKVIPHPELTLDQPDDVQRATQRVIASETRRAG
jgi:hypothetical protein